MYCEKCGGKLPDDAKFCGNCGAKVERKEEQITTSRTKMSSPVIDPQTEQATGTKKKSRKVAIIVGVILLLLALIAAILIIVKKQKDVKEYEDCVSMAERYLEELDYENAEALYLEAIEIDPKQREPYIELAKIYVEQEEYEKAEDILIQADEAGAEKTEDETEEEEDIKEQIDEGKNKPDYDWVVEPAIEAESIYYICSDNDYQYYRNELQKQKSCAYAVIQVGDKYGLIDMDGNLLTEIEYDIICNYGLYGEVCLLEKGDETFCYDEEYGLKEGFGFRGGRTVSLGELYYYNGLHNIYENDEYYSTYNDYSSELKDLTEAIPVREASALRTAEDTDEDAWKEEVLNGKYAVYYNGEFVTDFIYDECGSDSEGLLAVCQNGKWGYVNQKGEIVIPLEYDASWTHYYSNSDIWESDTPKMKDYCYAASEGFLVLCKDDQWELRDIEGNVVIKPGVFEEILPVFEGKCWVKQDGKWGLIRIEKNQNNRDLKSGNVDIPEEALEWNGHYYAIFESSQSWEEVMVYCESLGGHLATLTSIEENEAVYNYLIASGFDSAYFGLSDCDSEGTWSWINGEYSGFENWHDGEPNGENPNEDYAMFFYKFTEGTWNDGDFGNSTVNGAKPFICEWD